MENKVNYWAIADNGIKNVFLEKNFVSINYGVNEDFSLYKDELSVKRKLEELGRKSVFHNFENIIFHVKKGDYIILRQGLTKFFAIGIVNKLYYFDIEYKHALGVAWIKMGDWVLPKEFIKFPRKGSIHQLTDNEKLNLIKSILKDDKMNNTPITNELKEKLEKSRNIILRGAPGTGKTYLAKQIARELAGGNDEQIGFVQFHPSYDYTDFVEGLRPVSNDDGQIGFELQDGIFKQFCEKAKEAQKNGKQTNINEVEEVGGQDNFEEAWNQLTAAINEKQGQYRFSEKSLPNIINRNGSIKFGQGSVATKETTYDLYKGIHLHTDGRQKSVLSHLKKEYGLLDYVAPKEVSAKAVPKFIFIIDEINRGEISKIFGELFFSLDPGYRGRKGEVSTQYANLHETDEKFYIPENVYIIGTMNDIDRSVDTFDFAMRRRFRFVEITAESRLGMLDEELGANAEEAKARLTNLNQAISQIEGLNSHYHIGPSYFLSLKDLDFDYDLLWSDYLQPLLEDYLRGSYDEAEKLAELKAAYDNGVEADETQG